MDKYSKFSSSTEWRLGENVVLRLMECLTPTVKFDACIIISHLFVCQPICLSNRCAQQRKCTIIENKQLQKNGPWQI